MTPKISPLLNYDILGAFVNTVTANDQHPVQDCENLQFPIQMQNKKVFLNFLIHLWNLHQLLNIFEKKMIVTANVFPILQTVKTCFDHSLKSAVWNLRGVCWCVY